MTSPMPLTGGSPVPGDRVHRPGRPGAVVTVTGVLVALSCVAFAAVNIAFEISDHFAGGRYAGYASAITVMNWLVVVLKVIGAVVALLSIARRPRRVPAAVVTVLLWGAFATLTVYASGSVAQAIGMALGVTGTVDEIDLVGIAYVLFFVLLATGYGVLALSYSRRHRTRRRLALLGVVGAPVLLGLVLVAAPALLGTLGLIPPQ